jgi:hypothetical protein
MASMNEVSLQENAHRLEAEKQRLYEEMRHYPTPIAGCDQQFNYLLEQQAQVVAELYRVRQAIAQLALEIRDREQLKEE